jgi:hypothetical protein
MPGAPLGGGADDGLLHDPTIELGDRGLLEDMDFGASNDGFYSGSGAATVNLTPLPVAFGSDVEEGQKLNGNDGEKQGSSSTQQAAAAAAVGLGAAAGAMAAALSGGKLGAMQGVVGDTVGNMAAAAVPTSMKATQEKAAAFLQKAQPWRQFIWPLSIPTAAEGCSRMTANLYCFQTNYAILFIVQLVLAILWQPSALITLVMTAVVWTFFLKKNDDPDWKPVIGGSELGPMQRWLALAGITAMVLFIMAGSTIFNAAIMFVMMAFAHGVVHDPSNMALPGNPDAVVAGPDGPLPL